MRISTHLARISWMGMSTHLARIVDAYEYASCSYLVLWGIKRTKLIESIFEE